MELLDDLDSVSSKAKIFKRQIEIPLSQEDLSDTQQIDNDEDDGYTQVSRPSFKVLDLSKSSLLSASVDTSSTQKISSSENEDSLKNVFGASLSILERVKRRLNGEITEEESPKHTNSGSGNTKATQLIKEVEKKASDEYIEATQQIEEDSTQRIVTTLSQTIQSDTQLVEADTHTFAQQPESLKTDQIVSSRRKIDITQIDGANDDDNNDDDNFVPININKNETLQSVHQPPENSNLGGLFLSDSDYDDNDDEGNSLTIADARNTQQAERLKKIEELAAKKKAQRLQEAQNLKNKDNKDLEVKSKNKALEDELNQDEDEDEDVYNSFDEDENQENNIYLEPVTLKKFDKSSLFAAFGMKDDGKVDESKLKIEHAEKASSSPEPNLKGSQGFDLSESETDENGLDARKILSDKTDTSNSISTFSLKLKTQEIETKVIELDDDDDSDIDIEYSKTAMLDVKAMLSKKKSERKKALTVKNPAFMSKKQLWHELQKANREQLKRELTDSSVVSKERELLQEQTSSVENLLQKHIEQNNRIRQKEEELERWRKESARTFDSEGEEDSDYEDEVPESDYEEDGDHSSVEDNDDEDTTTTKAKKSRRSKNRMIFGDDEDDEDDGQDQLKIKLAKESDSHISLGIFGGNLTQSFDQNAQGKHETHDPEESPEEIHRREELPSPNDTQEKKPKIPVLEDDSLDTDQQLLEPFDFSSSQKHHSFQMNFEAISKSIDSTEAPSSLKSTSRFLGVENDKSNENDGNGDEDDPTQRDFLKPTKRLTKKRSGGFDDESSDEEEEQEESEKQKAERTKLIEIMKQQRHEMERERKRKRKELKAKGLDKIMEAEAEESEDEWHGIGGADGDGSDVENSEDEKMLDDYSKFKSNRADLAKRIAEENADKDEQMVKRLLYDIENGKLARRGHAVSGELDLSDGEDEVMRSYRIYNQLKYKEQLEKDEALRQLAKDKRSKAFFETIASNSQLESQNDIFNGVDSEDDEDDEEDGEISKNPFIDAPKKNQFKDPSTLSKKRKITEKFVQRQLSFISATDEEIEVSEKRSRRYSDLGSDDFNDDLSTLKRNSIIQIPEKTPKKKKVVDLEQGDPHGDTSPSSLFRMPSFTKSFQKVRSVSSSNEVTISTSYKVAGGAKSSVMAFGKRTEESSTKNSKNAEIRQNHRVLKVKKATKMAKSNRLKSFDAFADFDE